MHRRGHGTGYAGAALLVLLMVAASSCVDAQPLLCSPAPYAVNLQSLRRDVSPTQQAADAGAEQARTRSRTESLWPPMPPPALNSTQVAQNEQSSAQLMCANTKLDQIIVITAAHVLGYSATHATPQWSERYSNVVPYYMNALVALFDEDKQTLMLLDTLGGNITTWSIYPDGMSPGTQCSAAPEYTLPNSSIAIQADGHQAWITDGYSAVKVDFAACTVSDKGRVPSFIVDGAYGYGLRVAQVAGSGGKAGRTFFALQAYTNVGSLVPLWEMDANTLAVKYNYSLPVRQACNEIDVTLKSIFVRESGAVSAFFESSLCGAFMAQFDLPSSPSPAGYNSAHFEGGLHAPALCSGAVPRISFAAIDATRMYMSIVHSDYCPDAPDSYHNGTLWVAKYPAEWWELEQLNDPAQWNWLAANPSVSSYSILQSGNMMLAGGNADETRTATGVLSVSSSDMHYGALVAEAIAFPH